MSLVDRNNYDILLNSLKYLPGFFSVYAVATRTRLQVREDIFLKLEL